MQAIQTKTTKPTNANGARIRAKCAAGSILAAYDHGVDLYANHRAAAQQLADKLGWTVDSGYGRLECGQLVDGSYVHVFVESKKGDK